jgi:transposase InsO family protein
LPSGDGFGITLRTDNALLYASSRYRDLVKEYALQQEFILPHTPEQNGVAESSIGTLKLKYVWQQHFKTFAEAKTASRPGSTTTTSHTRGSATCRLRNGGYDRPK